MSKKKPIITCLLCRCRTDETQFCFGCRSYVCSGCDETFCTGEHAPRDHLRGESEYHGKLRVDQ